MDKRALETPAHRRHITALICAQIQSLQALALQLENNETDVSAAMLDWAQIQIRSVNELVVKMLAP